MPSAETVGLYLDNSTGYVLNAKNVGSEVRIQGYASFMVPAPENTTEQDRKLLLVQELKKAFTQANVKSKNISVCAPGDASMTRYFELPMLPKKEEKNAVRFEAQKYVPFDMKELYFGYEAYPDNARKKMGIVFMAAKKFWVDQITAVLKEANFRVVTLELMSQSIAKTYFFETTKDTSSIQVLISANDEKTAELIISQGPAVLVTRHLTLTTNPEAQQWDLPMLVSEIRLSFEFFNEGFKSQPISKICLLMEKTDRTVQLEQLLREEFNVPIEIASLLPSLKSDGVSVSQRAAAYGLSINKGKSLNLISSEAVAASAPTMSWEDEKKFLQDLATKAIIGVAACLFIVYFLLNQVASSKKNELARMAANYPASNIVSIAEPLEQIRSKETALMDKVSFSLNFFEKRPYVTQIMNELPRMIPANVLLTQLKFESMPSEKGLTSSSLRLEGYVLTSESGGSELSNVNNMVKQFVDNKEFMASFDEVKINSTKRANYKGAPVTRFSLDCLRTRKE